jgi:VanZ family protein
MTTKVMVKACCVVVLVLLVFVALGPAKYVPRSGLGWELDHFVGYFVITLMLCFAWPRPLLVGVAFAIFAVALEGLQAFPPDRSSNVFAAFISACGVLVATLIAELFIRTRRRFRVDEKA